MKSNTKLSRNCLKILLLVVLFWSCKKPTEVIEKKVIEPKLIVGKKYATSFDWKQENPFEPLKIDTVTITGLKNGYVEWQYKAGFKQSCKVNIFRGLLRHNH